MLEVAVPAHNSAVGTGGDFSTGQIDAIPIVSQVKYRNRTIGKKDVLDIRDMPEHHNSKGFLLIAYPRISSALFDHLQALRAKHDLKVEWWEKGELEARLRKHPDIARRYPKLLKLKPVNSIFGQ